MEYYFLLFFYLLMISLFLSFNSVFMFWILLELNLVTFILLMFYFSSSNSLFKDYDFILFYFVIQCLGSFLIIFSSFICFYGTEFFSMLVFLMGISIKMGIFPSYKWVVKISNYLDKFTFSVLLTLQKFPLFLGFFYLEFKFLVPFLVLSLLLGSLMIFFSKSIVNLLIFSSIYGSIWFFLLACSSQILLLIFISQYLFYLLMFFKFDSTSIKKDVYSYFTGVFLMGLPPFSFFFYKFFSLSPMYFFFEEGFIFFVWLCVFLSMMGYVNLFLLKSLSMENFYKISLNNTEAMIVFSSVFFVFLTLF